VSGGGIRRPEPQGMCLKKLENVDPYANSEF
jgi:hypothetical protein